jgi:hypothetical protein
VSMPLRSSCERKPDASAPLADPRVRTALCRWQTRLYVSHVPTLPPPAAVGLSPRVHVGLDSSAR